MGFSDNYAKKLSTNTTTSGSVQKVSASGATDGQTIPIIFCDDDGDDDTDDPNGRRTPLIPDQEILDSIEEIYFDAHCDIGIYELNVSVWIALR